jgi:hypothetical protein
MYLISEGTANEMGEIVKSNTLSQAKKALTTKIKAHETFCRKHDKNALQMIYKTIAGIDSVTDASLYDIPVRTWIVNIGGINRRFRMEVIHG